MTFAKFYCKCIIVFDMVTLNALVISIEQWTTACCGITCYLRILLKKMSACNARENGWLFSHLLYQSVDFTCQSSHQPVISLQLMCPIGDFFPCHFFNFNNYIVILFCNHWTIDINFIKSLLLYSFEHNKHFDTLLIYDLLNMHTL